MSELAITLLLDVLVAGMLGATIYYCVKLNKRVKLLQDSKSELAQLIQQFDESTQQATVSIQEIQKASKAINNNIQEKLDKANFLADDLAFMIERANKAADTLQPHVSGAGRGGASGGGKQAASARSAAAAEQPTEARGRGGSGGISELAQPSRREGRESAATGSRPRTRGGSDEKQSASELTGEKRGAEAMIDRISRLRAGESGSESGEAGQQQPSRQKKPMARMRSKSERELMQALNRDQKENS